VLSKDQRPAPQRAGLFHALSGDLDHIAVCRRGAAGVGGILARRICSSPREDRLRREHDQAEFGRIEDVQGRGMPEWPGAN
jgi:hypothetical protein